MEAQFQPGTAPSVPAVIEVNVQLESYLQTDKRRHDNETPSSTDERDGNNSSFIFVRPETPPKPTKHTSIDRPKKKWKASNTVSNKHQQPDNKEGNFPRNIENIKPIQSRNVVDTNRNIHRSNKSIHDNVDGRSNTMPPTTSRKHTTPEMAIPGTSTMGQTTEISNTNTPHNKPRTESNSSGTKSEPETDGQTYYTFILHKSNQNPNWEQAARRKLSPTFISFDHHDHHIIYSSDDKGGNRNRQRGRIAKYMGATLAGNTEINSTHSKVLLLRRFLLYCIRHGIESGRLHGVRIGAVMKDGFQIFNQLYHNRDPNEIDHEIKTCKKYIEEGKETNQRIGKLKRRNIVDTIQELLTEYAITSNSEWNLRIPEKIKHQLLREYGLSVDNYVQRLIRARKHNTITYFKETPLEALIRKHNTITYFKEIPLEALILDCIDEYMKNNSNIEAGIHENCDWIEYLFSSNNIDLPEFLAWNSAIKNMRYMKINTLVLQGLTNAGKSLIADTLISLCHPEEISRERDNSGFHLDQLPEASAVIFEEPCITPTNVGTWKLLFEGKLVKTDIKHKDKEGIRRLPIWVTTASKITTNIDSNEACQVNQRIKIFQFIHSIQHRQEDYTKLYCQTNLKLKKPPFHVQPIHFAFLFMKHWKKIRHHNNIGQRANHQSTQIET